MRMRLHWWLWQYVSEVTWVKLFKIIGILKFRLVVFMLKILEILEKDRWCWMIRAYCIWDNWDLEFLVFVWGGFCASWFDMVVEVKSWCKNHFYWLISYHLTKVCLVSMNWWLVWSFSYFRMCLWLVYVSFCVIIGCGALPCTQWTIVKGAIVLD